MHALVRPLPSVAEEGREAIVRRQRCVRSVPALSLEDIAAIVGRLRQHVATSDIERLERHQALAAGRAWVPVTLEAGGVEVDDPRQLRTLSSDGFSELRMRTFGYTVTLALGPSGYLITVDDRTRLALRSLSEIEAIVRRRRRVSVGFLASDWGVPSFVLALPIVASTLETALHRPGLALIGLGLASVGLVWWLWWTLERWAKRQTVLIPPDEGVPGSLPWRARAATVLGIVAVLAVVGFARMG